MNFIKKATFNMSALLFFSHLLAIAEDNPPFITNVTEALHELPGYTEKQLRNLMEIDRGPEGGKMLTLGLELAVNNTDVYELTETGLRLARRSSSTVDLEERASHPLHIKAPPFLEIEAQWSSLPIQSGEGNNILGENGQLQMKHKNIAIPIVEAASETLGYYGAILLEKGDSIQFPNPIFPLFRMNIGENYVSEFINSKEGGGFYLEYHKDQPHFHMPIKGSGYYILAKWNEDTTKLQITAFKIPDGKAVYTKKGAIHCDAALVGNLIVGYSTSEAFSTVLLRSEEKQFVDVIFESAHFLPLII